MRVMTAASISRPSAVSPSYTPRASIRAALLAHSEIAAIPALPYSAGGGGKTGALVE